MRTEQELDFGPVRGLRVGYNPAGKPLMNVICYQLDNILIDTGAKNTRPSLVKMIDFKALDKICLTHYHEDHAGNANYLNKTYKLPVYGHPLTCDALGRSHRLKPYELYMWGRLEPAEVTPHQEHFCSERYRFEIHHTPGHSFDHVVYLEKNEGWLFSGDMYLGSKIKYFRQDENIKDTIKSLTNISNMDFEQLFCGHNPQLSHGKRAIIRKTNYLQHIYGSVGHLLDQGKSPQQIYQSLLTGRESWLAKLITLGDVSYRNLITSAIRCSIESTE